MCYVLDKPLIADIDTAYGNAVTTIKTVNDFERAGASGVVIEDQISPKRCPICVTDLNTTISAEEAAGKIRAAAENRLYKDTLIIARTDITNVEERNRRAQMYLEAGADLVQGISKSYTASGNMVENIKQFVDAMDGRVSLVVCGGLDSLTRKDIEYIKPKICHFALVPINYMYLRSAQGYRICWREPRAGRHSSGEGKPQRTGELPWHEQDRRTGKEVYPPDRLDVFAHGVQFFLVFFECTHSYALLFVS